MTHASRRPSRPSTSLLRAALAVAAVAAFPPAMAESPRTVDRSAVRAAAARALDWLAAAQATDGSWGSGGFRGSSAVTATCTLALVGAGNTGISGSRSRSVSRGVGFLLDSAGGSGLIAGHERAAHGPMYGHAFATSTLAELYGETSDDDAVAAVLVRALDLIVRTQNDEGGWRYEPRRRDADLSVTAGVLCALRTLRNGGFAVPQDVVDRGVSYVRSLQNADGGFRYQSAPGPAAAPRTAAALFALLATGSDDDSVTRGFAWLAAHPVRLGGAPRLESGDGYALYGLFYTAAALRQRGGTAWDDWYPDAVSALLAAQRDDGAWDDPSCPEYGTSAALAVLQMPDDLLPFFQTSGPTP